MTARSSTTSSIRTLEIVVTIVAHGYVTVTDPEPLLGVRSLSGFALDGLVAGQRSGGGTHGSRARLTAGHRAPAVLVGLVAANRPSRAPR